jgi:hypothetical protein
VTSDKELWAEALAVERIHRHTAPEFVAVRIATLALKGDTTGVERWQEIAARVDQLRSGPRQ